MEKFNQRDCYCKPQRPQSPRCDCNPKPYHGHDHLDVDSMALAMQYVPWQHWNQIYCPEEGLKYGTIFPELNKPFYGKGACRR